MSAVFVLGLELKHGSSYRLRAVKGGKEIILRSAKFEGRSEGWLVFSGGDNTEYQLHPHDIKTISCVSW